MTPKERHRGVDFLRAASIIVVVGHWVMAAPWVDAQGAHLEHMLEHQPWTHWLTWGHFSWGWGSACSPTTAS